MIRVGFGILCFAVATILAGVMVRINLEPNLRSDGAGGRFVACIIFGIPLWVALVGGNAASVASGSLDWLSIGRGWQHVIAFVAATETTIALVFAAGLYTEAPGLLPVVLRPIIGWAMFAIPILAIIAGGLPFWRGTEPGAVGAIARCAQAGLAALVLVICAGLICQMATTGLGAPETEKPWGEGSE